MSSLTTSPSSMRETEETQQADERGGQEHHGLPWPLSLVETGDGELPLPLGPLLTGGLAFTAAILSLIVLDRAWGPRLALVIAAAWVVFNLTLLPRIWNRSALLVIALAVLSFLLPSPTTSLTRHAHNAGGHAHHIAKGRR